MKKNNNTVNFHQNPWIVLVIILISSFFLYGNTLWNKYCLDDSVVITRNEFTQKGLSGITDIFSTESFTGFFGKQKELVSGARYRPLSIATFAIEQEFFHGVPGISHFINILLFALTGFFIYLLIKKLVSPNYPTLTLVPIFTALLFIFHPIHTEVVANIKGRDEILALLFSLTGCYTALKYLETKKLWLLVLSAILWFLGLLSKENAIVFWVILPMMLFLAGIRNIKQYVKPVIAFSIAAIVFLVIRHVVIGSSTGVSDELMNNSFLQATSQQKYATIFYTLWRYIELLFIPSPLTYDYYPYQVPLVGWDNISALLGLASYTAIIIWLMVSIRKNFLITIALALYLLPLLPVSNVLFPIGTFMSERFVYFSSVGFCITLSLGIVSVIKYRLSLKYTVFSLVGIILVLCSFKIITRNQAWYNDYTLFTTDVKTSCNSAKSNCSAGGILLESSDTITNEERKLATINQSIHYLKKSIAIHLKYFDAWLLLGNAYFKKNNGVDTVLYCYSTILNLNPSHELAFQNLQALVNREKNIDTKLMLLSKMVVYQPNNYQVNYQLGNLYGKEKGDIEKSLRYLNKALSINPKEKDLYLDLGVAYGFKGDFTKSAEMLRKALELDPNNKSILINLGVTYKNLNQMAKAEECFNKAAALSKPNN